jgi:hypothetical protein
MPANFGVELGANDHRQPGDVEPEQSEDDGAERAVRPFLFGIRREIVDESESR